MVKCPNCGKENRDGLKVCLYCGSDMILEKPKDIGHTGHNWEDMQTPKPNHKNLKIFAVLVVFFILVFVLGSPSLLTYNNQSNLVELPDTNSQIIDNSSSNLESPLNFFEDSPSTKNVNFSNLFTMDIDNDVNFEDMGGNYKYTRHWYYSGNSTENSITVYYWLSNQNYTFDELYNEYEGPEKEGKLFIFTSNDKKDYPQSTDYLVLVRNDEKGVGIEGADLETLKKYANSVEFIE